MGTGERRRFTENNPNAAILTYALRNIGYDNMSALCDIIDNSIDAEAKTIKIYIKKVKDSDNGNFQIMIADNGYGMTKEVLDQALRLGSDSNHDITSELGKFGMGLCTASLAIGRRLEVLTSTKDNDYVYHSISDVDIIQEVNRFVKTLDYADEAHAELYNTILAGEESGTIVILDKCDRIKRTNLPPFVNSIRKELSRVFRLFIQAGLEIYVNDELCEASDPLMADAEGAEVFSDEVYPVSVKTPDGEVIEDTIRIKLATLPDYGMENNRFHRINVENQGFYILRNNREIQSGQSLGFYHKHPVLNRFRGEIYFNASLDEVMGVDFRKSGLDIHQSMFDIISRYIGSQITMIRRRLEKAKVVVESGGISHKDSEKAISRKSKLLLTPKGEKEKRERPEDQPEKPGGVEPKDTDKTRTPRDKKQPAVDTRVRFEAASGGRTGHIYEAYMEGRTIVIQWNIDHPFYERFVVMTKDNKTMSTSVDFLIYSLATSELYNSDEENLQVIDNIKTIMSQNLRTLLD